MHDIIHLTKQLTQIIISNTSNKATNLDISELIYGFKNWWPGFHRKSPVYLESSQNQIIKGRFLE